MSDIEKEKSSFAGSLSSSRDKTYSYRGNGGKRSRHYGSNRSSRNGNAYSGNDNGVKEQTPAVDLSNITLTEEEKKALDLKNLKSKDIHSLIRLAHKLKIENPGGMKRQDMVFEILKRAGQLGDIWGSGVLEVLSEGYGFLRSPDYNYLPAVDDIYVSPSQIRKWGLKSGDTISGTIRPPKDGERYFAILKIDQLNFNPPEKSREKNLFDNLTPLYPQESFSFGMEAYRVHNSCGGLNGSFRERAEGFDCGSTSYGENCSFAEYRQCDFHKSSRSGFNCFTYR